MARNAKSAFILVNVLLAAAACSTSVNSQDGGIVTGTGNDGGTTGHDAGVTDGGQAMDAGTDGGLLDAGVDGGLMDAGTDGGQAMDAGTDGGQAMDAGTDGGMVGCDDLSGFYLAMGATCTMGANPPTGACVTQTGCNVTVTTDEFTYTGTVSGSTATFSATVNLNGTSANEQCTGTRNGDMIPIDCTVMAGAATIATCTIPATKQMAPLNAASVCCDPVAQTCGNNDRCSYVVPPASPVAEAACLPSQGMVMEGQDCMRSGGPGGMDPGYDNCAAGLFCTSAGLATNASPVCRKLCKKMGDCPNTEACVQLFAVPPGGVCEPTCTLLGTGCSAGTDCRPAFAADLNGARTTVGVCSATGTAAVGAACTHDTQCGAGAACVRTAAGDTCQTLCDSAHACTGAGATCTSLNDPGQTTLGYCTP